MTTIVCKVILKLKTLTAYRHENISSVTKEVWGFSVNK